MRSDDTNSSDGPKDGLMSRFFQADAVGDRDGQLADHVARVFRDDRRANDFVRPTSALFGDGDDFAACPRR